MNIDKWGLLVQADGDGGDTLAREAAWGMLTPRFKKMPEPMLQLQISKGIWVRHIDPNKWYSDPKTTSRDQLVPLIILLGALGTEHYLWWLLKATLKRGGFAQNTRRNWGQPGWKIPDSMHMYMGLFIRAMRLWWLYPLLWVFDLWMLAGAIVDVRPWRSPEDVDDLNGILMHLQATLIMPTPVSWLARNIYAKFRPVNKGNTELNEKHPVMGAIAYYFDPRWGGNIEFVELYRPMIEKYIGM